MHQGLAQRPKGIPAMLITAQFCPTGCRLRPLLTAGPGPSLAASNYLPHVLLHAGGIWEQALLCAEPASTVCSCPQQLFAGQVTIELPNNTLPWLWSITRGPQPAAAQHKHSKLLIL